MLSLECSSAWASARTHQASLTACSGKVSADATYHIAQPGLPQHWGCSLKFICDCTIVKPQSLSTWNDCFPNGYRSILDQKLEAVMAQRQKFSFQPYVTSPPSAINIIMSRMCSMGSKSPMAGLPLGEISAVAV